MKIGDKVVTVQDITADDAGWIGDDGIIIRANTEGKVVRTINPRFATAGRTHEVQFIQYGKITRVACQSGWIRPCG